MNTRYIIFAIATIATLLFACSLAFPAYYFRDGHPAAVYGLMCLLSSPVAFFMGYPETLANLLFGLWWLGLSRGLTRPFSGKAEPIVLALLALIATFFAALFFTRSEMPTGTPLGSLPVVPGPGFYFWFGSMLFAVFGSVLLIFTVKNQITNG